MRPLSADVERKVVLSWPSGTDRTTARSVLSRYGRESYEVEVDRVQLAILKLGGVSLDDLEEMTAAAKTDYRDVLMWAEYPEEARTRWALRPDLSDKEQQALADIRRRDRDQYEHWLST